MQNRPFQLLHRISYLLLWGERFVALTSGLSLTCALLIAGASTAYLGRFSPQLLGAITFAWVILTTIAIDTQLVAALGAWHEATTSRNRFWWGVVVLVLIVPAFIINDVFAQTTNGLATTDIAALSHLGVSAFLWTHTRALYGILLLCVSRLTRPLVEQKIAESITIPQGPPKNRRGKNVPKSGRTSSTRGRRKRVETAMTLWRESEAARLYSNNPKISARKLAAELTYNDSTTGIAYVCSPETASQILRPMRQASRTRELEEAA